MSFFIKVCGITQQENLEALSALPIDWFGFIRYPLSKRHVKDLNLLETSIPQKKVVVFVDASAKEIMDFTKKNQVDYCQLHGGESPQTCQLLKANGVNVIKAFSVDEQFDFSLCQPFEEHCDYFLFDTKGKNPGGNGIRFDWKILKQYKGKVPFLLSGGIGPDHLEDITQFAHSQWAGIDLNSQFEKKPGLKDIKQLSEFLKNLKVLQ